MKAKYYFKSISSEAEELKVKSYGVDIMTFKKEDFNDSWDNLVEKQYDLSPYSSADLSKIVSTGEEDHDAEYPGELKEKWYEYARNKIHEDFFQNTERLAEIDTSRPIELMNKSLIDTSTKLRSFMQATNNIPSYGKYKYDLSSMNLADEFLYDKNSSKARLLVDDTGATIPYAFSNLNIKSLITKLPNIPSTFTNYAGTFRDFTSLKDISNLDFSQVINLDNAFANCTSLSNIDNVKFDLVENLSSAFKQCSNIERLPNMNLSNCKNLNNAFCSCDNIKSVGNIKFGKDQAVTYKAGFITSGSLEEIGDIINFPSCSSSTDSTYAFISTANLKKVGNILADNPNITITTRIINCNTHSEGLEIESIYSPLTTVYPISRLSTNSSLNIKYLGPATIASYGDIYTNSIIKEAVALSPYFANYSSFVKSSTGSSIWVDYTNSANSITKTITKDKLNYSLHIDTAIKSVSKDVEIDLLQINDDYPYEISIDEITKIYSISGITDAKNCKNVKISFIDNKVMLHFEAEAADNLVATFTCTLDGIEYDATILGHPFHGKTRVVIKASIDFTVTEDANLQILIEDDEPEEQTEQNA